MVAGHLPEEKGYFYTVLNYNDINRNCKTVDRNRDCGQGQQEALRHSYRNSSTTSKKRSRAKPASRTSWRRERDLNPRSRF